MKPSSADNALQDRSASQQGLLRRFVLLEPNELKPAVLSAAYFFFLLSSYFVMRPIREEMGVAGGVRNLPWLFMGTMIAMVVASQFFAVLASRTPRWRFIPLAYRFCIVNLLVFFFLFHLVDGEWKIHLGRAFYIWVSVFNLFVVSIFWSLMADCFNSGQAKRLFGLIAVGGTAGAISGSAITGLLVGWLGVPVLLLVAMVLLELGTQCAKRLMRPTGNDGAQVSMTPLPTPEPGPGVFAGLTLISRSIYLQGICVHMLIYTITSTLLYFEQARIVEAFSADPNVRIPVFAGINIAENTLTILMQFFLTARIVKRAGIGLTLAIIPSLTMLGFLAMAYAPPGMWLLIVLIAFQSLRRAVHFAVSRPTREMLYTVLGADEKYKSKNFIDTAVYRAGDVVGAGTYKAIVAASGGLAAVAVPLCALWVCVSVFLGARQRKLAQAADQSR
ncbi:MAG TPA: hypothetical protein PK400_09415 [Phycisphaerales bacterium]|nr:hypothetical protein [Phycisphaerales bacterium]